VRTLPILNYSTILPVSSKTLKAHRLKAVGLDRVMETKRIFLQVKGTDKAFRFNGAILLVKE
jgi:hypothetical protein